MYTYKRFMGVFWLLMFFASLLIGNSINVYSQPLPGYKKVAENKKYVLLLNPENLSIAIKHKKTGRVFKQFPDDWQNDFSVGMAKMSIPSHLVCEMVDENANVTIYNSFALGVNNGEHKIVKIKDGIRIDYFFETQEMRISIEFKLNPEGLTVRVPVSLIKEPKELRLSRIWLMPYFMSAKRNDNGYLFVPDGSGAIINFKESFGNERGFELPVYGFDNGLPVYDMRPKVEGIRLPVFGIKKGDTAILGVIRSGDYSASIFADIAGNATGYFRVFPIFTYRDVHKFLLYERDISSGQSGEVVDVLVSKVSPYKLKRDIIVDYYFLTGNDANYSGMARVYRDFLIKNKILKKVIYSSKDIPINISLIGGIKSKSSFLGIPMMRFTPTTTFKQAISILNELLKRGIKNINLDYKGYQPGGYQSKITNGITLNRKLGGYKDFRELVDFCRRNGIKMSLTAEIVEVHEVGNGFSDSKDANRYLNNGIAFLYEWDPVTKKKNREYPAWFNVMPTKIEGYANNFVKDLHKYNVGMMTFEKIGEYIYSQNKKGSVLTREEVGNVWENMLNRLSRKTDLIFTHGNQYVLPYSKILLNVPLDCSNFAIESESVPFYQMVVHGYIPYSGRPGNLRDDWTFEMLRMIEYGAIPYYELTYAESSIFKKTFFTEMTSSNYKDWMERIVNEYKKANEAYRFVYDVPIELHEKIRNGVYRTVYRNGIEIVVNYNNVPIKYRSKIIKPKDFAVIK